MFSSSGRAAATEVQGTVEASVHALEKDSYGSLSDSWIRGTPLGVPAYQSPEGLPPRPRAKDLVAELDRINAQIHRMMFQVERAVARLAASG